jgi:hypothetical protein
MENNTEELIPLELLFVLCARSILSGGKVEEIDKLTLQEIKNGIELELEKREATYH